MGRQTAPAPPDVRCIGLWGKLNGHKFVKVVGGFVYREGHCFRCGMPKGGWKNATR